ncbi:thyrotropin subunit beta-like [Anguilla rostrata]|uniref:thyrotropin subunit beta-like n=1 Tax=Anguilla rostrata TaxID=7938 RepID=UPI0030D0C5CC
MALDSLACVLLCLLLGQALAKCVPQNYTLYVEREGCEHCVAVNTTVCRGFCFSRDTNMKKCGLKGFPVQRACMYQSLVYHAVSLPGCPPDVDPLFSFPVALRCHCSRCNTSNTECLHRGKRLPNPCDSTLCYAKGPPKAATAASLTGTFQENQKMGEAAVIYQEV